MAKLPLACIISVLWMLSAVESKPVHYLGSTPCYIQRGPFVYPAMCDIVVDCFECNFGESTGSPSKPTTLRPTTLYPAVTAEPLTTTTTGSIQLSTQATTEETTSIVTTTSQPFTLPPPVTTEQSTPEPTNDTTESTEYSTQPVTPQPTAPPSITTEQPAPDTTEISTTYEDTTTTTAVYIDRPLQ